jgi:hypothetical protein
MCYNIGTEQEKGSRKRKNEVVKMEISFVNVQNQTAYITRYISMKNKTVSYFANYGYYNCRDFGNLADAKKFLEKKGYKEA